MLARDLAIVLAVAALLRGASLMRRGETLLGPLLWIVASVVIGAALYFA